MSVDFVPTAGGTGTPITITLSCTDLTIDGPGGVTGTVPWNGLTDPISINVKMTLTCGATISLSIAPCTQKLGGGGIVIGTGGSGSLGGGGLKLYPAAHKTPSALYISTPSGVLDVTTGGTYFTFDASTVPSGSFSSWPVPADVTSVTAYYQGEGGSGYKGVANTSGGGGGGSGANGVKTIATSGGTISVSFGLGGSGTATTVSYSGGGSWSADYGKSATSGTGGAKGAASSSTGDTVWDGAAGGNGHSGTGNAGGGGGAGAGSPTAVGNAGTAATGNPGGAGGRGANTPDGDGGPGGEGSVTLYGSPGRNAGGGGGGGGSSVSGYGAGGAGASGRVVLMWGGVGQFAVSGVTPNFVFDASTATAAQTAQALGTLIERLNGLI
jgi:hypothetical protein